ncbi:MAG: hypothetical protein DI565_12800 [Ancylobacter novellus]|uniref:Uncharacterized protein n=1 Tax=Ancylobacter novellus TaxID=921 RepID=A0A2W5MA40_ANCNO|nr:MAG: hypothetical protein DI565_12800 [Ancylobacter novellus]
MTAFERDMVHVVDDLRALNWQSAFALGKGHPLKRSPHFWPWHEDIHHVEGWASDLRSAGDPALTEIARRYDHVAAELRAGPRIPSTDEVVARYAAGEVGDRTARYVLGMEVGEFYEAVAARGLPPWSGSRAEDDE